MIDSKAVRVDVLLKIHIKYLPMSRAGDQHGSSSSSRLENLFTCLFKIFPIFLRTRSSRQLEFFRPWTIGHKDNFAVFPCAFSNIRCVFQFANGLDTKRKVVFYQI